MTERAHVVLVVDDDFDIRDTLGDVLSDEGYAAAFAADGFEALEYLRTQPLPCVILLDWMMPRCDGATFRVEQLKDERIRDVPVVLLTADAKATEKGVALGAVACLKKPVNLDDLTAVISRYCKRSP